MGFHQEWLYLEGLKPVLVPSHRQAHKPHPRTLTGTSFLDEVLEAIVNDPRFAARQLERLAVVVPSHRAMAKLRHGLRARMDGPARMPQFYALSGFIEASSNLAAADPLEVLARMYRLIQEEDDAPTFDRFVPWATVVLSDFAAVDHELSDVHNVFQNLADIQGIEDWSFGEPALSEDQKAFERQWRRLPGLYHKLHGSLQSDGLATRAQLTRSVAEGKDRMDVDHVLAAGLATMSKAEWRCLQRWEESDALTILWDGDASYVDDPHNEAGLFIRKYRNRKGAFPRSTLAKTPPVVNAVGCSSTVSQTQYVRDTLSKLTPEELDQTLVILPDGSSLGTLLQALPEQPNGINVTMGLALHETPVQSFVEHLFGMLETDSKSWRLEQIQALHAHPVIHQAYGDKDQRWREGRAMHRMIKGHRAWVQGRDFVEEGAPEWGEVMDSLGGLRGADPSAFLNAMSQWAKELEGRLEAMPAPLDLKSESKPKEDAARALPWIPAGWRRFRTVLAVLERLQHAHGPMKDAREARAMARRLLRQERIDLLGEPNQGLQIMGLTEARALDFDRVLVLDMNEGIVPQTSMPDSFLPLDLRSHLGMPGPREREARYAYLIHRIFHRAREVHLLHRSSPDRKDGGEPSRYLMQLAGSFHKKDGTPYLRVHPIIHQLPLPDARPEMRPMTVTDVMRNRLSNWAADGMSPSAINTLLQCPRNFAYRYLYKMGEATELKSSMEASTLGSVVHWVMEHGLKAAQGHLLTTGHLDQVAASIDTLLEQALESEYNASLVHRGENVLQLEIARATIQKFLRQEKGELASGTPAPLIVELEQKLRSDHPGTAFGTMAFRGIADRRETVRGVPRVVDYKSGKVEAKELKLKGDWTEQLEGGDKPKALQLIVYATMVLASLSPEDGEKGVLAAIRSGRNVREGLLSLRINGEPLILPQHAETFVHWLADRLTEFAATDHVLEHKSDAKYCEHCVVLDPTDNFSF